MSNIQYSECPVCKKNNFDFFIKAKDHTVSNEVFDICICKNCQFKFTQNVPSEEEIGKYYASEDYISHSDTQEGFINKLYHFARSYMLNSKKTLVNNCLPRSADSQNGKKLLDIGCGTGYFLNAMQEDKWDVVGIEPDDGARKICIDKFKLPVHSNEHLFELPKLSMNVISMWHVLEHIHRLDDYLAQIHSLLKSDGRFIVAVPNCDSHDANKYNEVWAAWDVPRHLYHFTPPTMELLMKNNGFNLVTKHLMPFDAFYVSLLSERYKDGGSIGGFLTGGVSLLKSVANVDKSSSVIYVMEKVG